MTNEEKQLLLKDLCARLPYNVFCQEKTLSGKKEIDVYLTESVFINFKYGTFLCFPYLRSMSSITDEEKDYVIHLADLPCAAQICEKKVDFFLSHHIDWRGLIPMGLAIEAPEGMYNI